MAIFDVQQGWRHRISATEQPNAGGFFDLTRRFWYTRDFMAKSKVKGTFKLHDRVVYPLQGVGEVTEIIDMEFKGKVMPYYVMYFAVSDMTVKVPVDKAEGLGIRGIVPKKEAAGRTRAVFRRV